MKEEEAVRIFDLVVKEHMLPATLDKLVPLSFMGAAAVKFYQAKVKLMDQLGASEEQRKATLADGQDAGEMLLNIEARIGELYEAAPNLSRAPKEEKSRSDGRTSIMDKRKGANAIAVHHNPAAVAAIIKEARENEDIPTKTAVLNKIRADKAEIAAAKYKEEVTSKKQESNSSTKGEALKYLSKLREVVLVLPAEVPKEGWSEASFAEAQAMVEIIIRRLKSWQK